MNTNLTTALKMVYEFDLEDEPTTQLRIEHQFLSEPMVTVIIDGYEAMLSVKYEKSVVVITANVGLKGKVIMIG